PSVAAAEAPTSSRRRGCRGPSPGGAATAVTASGRAGGTAAAPTDAGSAPVAIAMNRAANRARSPQSRAGSGYSRTRCPAVTRNDVPRSMTWIGGAGPPATRNRSTRTSPGTSGTSFCQTAAGVGQRLSPPTSAAGSVAWAAAVASTAHPSATARPSVRQVARGAPRGLLTRQRYPNRAVRRGGLTHDPVLFLPAVTFSG